MRREELENFLKNFTAEKKKRESLDWDRYFMVLADKIGRAHV